MQTQAKKTENRTSIISAFGGKGGKKRDPVPVAELVGQVALVNRLSVQPISLKKENGGRKVRTTDNYHCAKRQREKKSSSTRRKGESVIG